jgi:hypothetical protein
MDAEELVMRVMRGEATWHSQVPDLLAVPEHRPGARSQR